MSKDEPKKPDPAPEVDVADIPLPPEEQWDDLDNSAGAATDRAEAKPAPRAAVPPAQIADLEFEGCAYRETVPLEHPFRHPQTGEWVRSVTVERLPIGQVARLVDRFSGETYDKFEIYSLMTGLPAPVLRGLKDVDGDRVTEVAYDFLPRVFRPASASSRT
jgi:hypothetical protein